MLSLLATGIADSRAGAREAAMAAAESMAKLMLTMLNLCLPALCKHHAAAELSALAKIILPGLIDEPKIVVRVNPQMVPVMEAEVAALDFELAERIHLLPTDAVAPGDARISWGDGSVIRDAGSARRMVEDALASMGLLQREMTDA
jgi:flagellar assembly protein FliH